MHPTGAGVAVGAGVFVGVADGTGGSVGVDEGPGEVGVGVATATEKVSVQAGSAALGETWGTVGATGVVWRSF